ncbi:DIVALENT CATION TOLERANCE PROTEIN [Cupriavidus taiwanensis]|uniref:DIVALENT CATION TOLERANCE PROTEIN n=1 Tax=Cupriavidus taiwanensis TaxID=164546 RepID=A0A375H3B1_9BURK|nr:divalent-cation tolerance protein CutA [Cupriavidus taiwanensis]SOY51941.1 DIVALENT CATION TOLERANCE PROTEIN [Cupriavidus taiwanensis]SOY52113.1 DIVALENT CATION TOLERANCE PROTEIN [Cupriavidus taiwanensis]SOY84475.1 DIVALENT CATION TOLERANCE PROTEIN [Cupriavidus taiwanensis]SOZ59183.1 DIVALENT CATION TOLERANCE PROTEIN [Cupriavidus taiwanensis]SOZ80320.1 DIVALENT CATION TOLERANCE PROTEIN [Cupriavidus taiwanensis]
MQCHIDQGAGPDEVLVVITNAPDADTAARLSRAVLQARAAACVNRLAPVESEYWWQGKLEQAREWPLLIKTTRASYAALEAVIRQHHPYDVPELLAWPVSAGYAPYLEWVHGETAGAQARAGTAASRDQDKEESAS